MALHIPFLSRLHVREYLALFLSFFLIALESLISIITLALPSPIINFCYRLTRRLFDRFSSPSAKRAQQKKKGIWEAIANASDFSELVELYGYTCEEHIVQTGDGYLLGLHRLGWKRGEEDARVNTGDNGASTKKKVVYLHHGLMMNSEVWVCLTERERCLPFELVERGYDVWLGNSRGNKYSKKSVHTPPTSSSFWNFSMDQFAFHDIPDSIGYILETTHQPSLSYIGFSQGTAQAFATLSIHPALNEKVDVFIALAPAMSPKGIASGIVDSFVKTSPDILYLAFGRKSILPSTTMWQSILYPPIFVRLIDQALRFLFAWTGANITADQKLAAYPHLYSYTSTKSVVHWFQIIRNGVFQMYDDEAPNPITSNRSKYYKVAKFPTKNIKTPIVLVYGGADSLVDIKVMLRELPRHTIAKEIPHYEHLDFLWAQSVGELVFPHVFEALNEHAGSKTKALEGQKEERFRNSFLESSIIPRLDGDDQARDVAISLAAQRSRKILQNTRRLMSFDGTLPDENPMLYGGNEKMTSPTRRSTRVSPRKAMASNGAPEGLSPQTSPTSPPEMPNMDSYLGGKPSPSRSKVMSPPPTFRLPTQAIESPGGESVHASQATNKTTTSRPEGWWSSDEGEPDPEPEPVPKPSRRATSNGIRSPRRRSFDSQRSTNSLKNGHRIGDKGISIGVGRAISGVVEGHSYGENGNGEKWSEPSTATAEDKKKKKRATLKKRANTLPVVS